MFFLPELVFLLSKGTSFKDSRAHSIQVARDQP